MIPYIAILLIESSLNTHDNHPLLLLPLPGLDPCLNLGEIVALETFIVKTQFSIALLNLEALQPHEAICLLIVLADCTASILIEMAATDFVDVLVREFEFHIIETFGGEEGQILQLKELLAISKS